jgi:protein-disulfide isomerase
MRNTVAKFFSFTFLLLVCAVTARADIDFSIGEPELTVTDKMMANGRVNAIKHADEMLHSPQDVVVGNPTGSVTMIQFVDFLCPLSEKMDPAIQALIKDNPDLRIVYKPYPIRGEVSSYAAQAAWAANQQGKYQPYHVALMRVGNDLTLAKIIALAKSQGIDSVKLQAEINAGQFTQAVTKARKLAGIIGVPGTPALFFAKTNLTTSAKQDEIIFMLGTFTQSELQAAVDQLQK